MPLSSPFALRRAAGLRASLAGLLLQALARDANTFLLVGRFSRPAEPELVCCRYVTSLPGLAQKFAADFGFARGAPAHQTFRRGDNADAQAADDRANIRGADISARPRTRDALYAGDHAAAVRRVLQEDAKHLARFVFVDKLEGRDVTLVLQNTRDFGLELGHGNVHALMLCCVGVANSRQKIAYGIRLHNFPVGSYQLAFTTPGISPLSAMPRKQILHI